MDTLELLSLAIKQNKQISFEYVCQGSAEGVRTGHPHAIFLSSADNLNIDIFKIGGVTTNPNKPLPGWRQYRIKEIRNVVIHENNFLPATGYNPNSKQYARVIVKI